MEVHWKERVRAGRDERGRVNGRHGVRHGVAGSDDGMFVRDEIGSGSRDHQPVSSLSLFSLTHPSITMPLPSSSLLAVPDTHYLNARIPVSIHSIQLTLFTRLQPPSPTRSSTSTSTSSLHSSDDSTHPVPQQQQQPDQPKHPTTKSPKRPASANPEQTLKSSRFRFPRKSTTNLFAPPTPTPTLNDPPPQPPSDMPTSTHPHTQHNHHPRAPSHSHGPLHDLKRFLNHHIPHSSSTSSAAHGTPHNHNAAHEHHGAAPYTPSNSLASPDPPPIAEGGGTATVLLNDDVRIHDLGGGDEKSNGLLSSNVNGLASGERRASGRATPELVAASIGIATAVPTSAGAPSSPSITIVVAVAAFTNDEYRQLRRRQQ